MIGAIFARGSLAGCAVFVLALVVLVALPMVLFAIEDRRRGR